MMPSPSAPALPPRYPLLLTLALPLQINLLHMKAQMPPVAPSKVELVMIAVPLSVTTSYSGTRCSTTD